VAIARALANEPRLVLADEPTGNLDRESSDTVADVLRGLPDEHGCTVVLVTHDPDLAARADRALVLDRGRLAPATTAASFTARPITAE
jgi:predicted ABC-type transport system involved in lysophospholipase L1 biosynthesis ATPase subunit